MSDAITNMHTDLCNKKKKKKIKEPPIGNAAYLEIQVKYYWGCEF